MSLLFQPLRIILSLVLIIGLIGCELFQKKKSEEPLPESIVEDLSLNSSVRQNRQVKSAITLLENGNITAAIEFLDEVLAVNSEHPTATFLKKQLDLPIDQAGKFFKTQRFIDYTLKKDDNLASLADDWLGNSLYFVILSRINNIKNPMQLKPTTKIKIPVLASSKLVKNEKRRSATSLKKVKTHIENKSFTAGLEKINNAFILPADLNPLIKLQKELLAAFAKSSISFNDKEKMLSLVSNAKQSAPNQKQVAIYKTFIYQQKRELLLDQAMLLFDDKSYIDAASKLVSVKKIDDEMKESHEKSIIEKPLLDKLHEQAIVMYSQNDLKNALSYWKLILGVQPDNQLAQKYIQRTETLLNKLNEL